MSRRLHICHVLLSLRPGGLENGVVNIANRLPRDRFRSSVCCLQQSGDFSQRLAPDVDLRAFGLQRGNDPLLPFRLARHLRASAVDIVHTRNPEALLYGYPAARLAGARIVHSEHGRTFPEKTLRRWVLSSFVRRTEAAFAVSRTLKDDLVRYLDYPEDHLAVLYNGVDCGRFAPRARVADRGLDRPLTIGSVGRLVAVKNYALLLQAAAGLPEDLRARVLLIGDGPERPALERLAAELNPAGAVTIAGNQADVPAALAAMDIFVLPSLSEGLSNTVLEAMAAGLPVVATRVGGNPELVEHGVTGLLFGSGDVHELSEHLTRLARDPALRLRLGEAARARACSEFAIDSMVRRYADLYTHIGGTRDAQQVVSARC